MTGEEWAKVVEWLAVRFPTSQWNADQAVAYYYDVKRFDPEHVWAGIESIYRQGAKYAPTGSEIVAAASRIRRDAAERARYETHPALPEKRTTWEDYTMARFGERLTAIEVIRRVHAEQSGCVNPDCDIHRGNSDE